ncbi:Triosephosphate isomerase [Clostridiaceae bacterium JG1575]|nr:Triosephosphate isomerase [Clostridiaceae bacterium JG1575]
MRTPVIAGNWKMNHTLPQAIAMVDAFLPLVEDASCEVLLCVPFIHLPALVEKTKGSAVKIGAQNLYFEENGAFTGEISAPMLKDLGVSHVIVGHSERREIFGETDEWVNQKVHAAFRHGLIPILCCGETLQMREKGQTKAHLQHQIREGLKGLSEEQAEQIIIAYEPIWAIGTGKTATAQEANETIASIRQTVAQEYRDEIAQKVRIQYGGSVKPSTIKEQMSMSDIDGALVGGASLKAEEFSQIVLFDR